jgi:hypothetical protein
LESPEAERLNVATCKRVMTTSSLHVRSRPMFAQLAAANCNHLVHCHRERQAGLLEFQIPLNSGTPFSLRRTWITVG